jgi:ABC-type Fe3+/spermidine/putrescine transport system ATPase subunit
MLELDGIGLTLGAFSLRDISLRIGTGEYFVLLGPTGAGKTALLEIVCGLLRPGTGTVRWSGRDITRLPPESRPLAVVFQDLGLFDHLTVAGNIEFGPRVRGVSRTVRSARARDLAARLGIDHLLGRRVAGLSGGERQRVALARALAVEPELLLLDEPLSALDGVTRDALRDELRSLHRTNGLTVVHVTHDREEALYLATRIAVLLDRRLHTPTAPESLFRSPPDPDVAAFLGLRNVLSVDAASDGRVVIGELELRSDGASPSTRAVWIRPDAVELHREPPELVETGSTDVPVTVDEAVMLGPMTEVRCRAGGLSLRVLVPDSEAVALDARPGDRLVARLVSRGIYAFPTTRPISVTS